MYFKKLTVLTCFLFILSIPAAHAQTILKDNPWDITPYVHRYDWKETVNGGVFDYGTTVEIRDPNGSPDDTVTVRYFSDFYEISFKNKKDYLPLQPLIKITTGPYLTKAVPAHVEMFPAVGPCQGDCALPYNNALRWDRLEKLFGNYYVVYDVTGTLILAYIVPENIIIPDVSNPGKFMAIHPNGLGVFVASSQLPVKEQEHFKTLESLMGLPPGSIALSNKIYSDDLNKFKLPPDTLGRVPFFGVPGKFNYGTNGKNCIVLVVFITGLGNDATAWKDFVAWATQTESMSCFDFVLFPWEGNEVSDEISDKLVTFIRESLKNIDPMQIRPYREIAVVGWSFGGVVAAKAASKLDSVVKEFNMPIRVHTYATPLLGKSFDGFNSLGNKYPMGSAITTMINWFLSFNPWQEVTDGFGPYKRPESVKVVPWYTTDANFQSGDGVLSGPSQNNPVEGSKAEHLFAGPDTHTKFYLNLPLMLKAYHTCAFKCVIGGGSNETLRPPPQTDITITYTTPTPPATNEIPPAITETEGPPPPYLCRKNATYREPQCQNDAECNPANPTDPVKICDVFCQCIPNPAYYCKMNSKQLTEKPQCDTTKLPAQLCADPNKECVGCMCVSKCGNGRMDPGEQCDPKNVPDGCPTTKLCTSECICKDGAALY